MVIQKTDKWRMISVAVTFLQESEERTRTEVRGTVIKQYVACYLDVDVPVQIY